jgi:hypothetical protein
MLFKPPSVIKLSLENDFNDIDLYRKLQAENLFTNNKPINFKTEKRNQVHFAINSKVDHIYIGDEQTEQYNKSMFSSNNKIFYNNHNDNSIFNTNSVFDECDSIINNKKLIFSSAVGNISSEASNKITNLLLDNSDNIHSTTPFNFCNVNDNKEKMNESNQSVNNTKNNIINNLVINSYYSKNRTELNLSEIEDDQLKTPKK